MRKCPECGYLLLGDGETCKHCGAAIPVGAAAAVNVAPPPPAPAPGASTEPDVPRLWRPSPTATRPPTPVWAAPPPPPSPDGPPPTAFWRPVEIAAPAPPKTPSIAKRVLVIAVGVLAAVCGAAAVRAVFGNGLPPGTSSFVDGHGIDYMAPDHSYMARFPVVPVERQQPITVGQFSANLNSALVEKDDYEIGTASMQLPIAVPADKVNDALDGAMNNGIVKTDGKLVSKNHVTRGGFATVDATFKARDGYTARGLVMVHGSVLYMEFVHAKTGTDRLFKALDASFVPLAG